MENRYVAIYTRVALPDVWGGTPEDWIRDGILIKKEVSSIKEAYKFFVNEIKEKGVYNVWNMQIYDKVNKKYIEL